MSPAHKLVAGLICCLKAEKRHKKNNQFAAGYFLRPRLFASASDILPNLTIRKLKIGKILNGCFAVIILAKC